MVAFNRPPNHAFRIGVLYLFKSAAQRTAVTWKGRKALIQASGYGLSSLSAYRPLDGSSASPRIAHSVTRFNGHEQHDRAAAVSVTLDSERYPHTAHSSDAHSSEGSHAMLLPCPPT